MHGKTMNRNSALAITAVLMCGSTARGASESYYDSLDRLNNSTTFSMQQTIRATGCTITNSAGWGICSAGSSVISNTVNDVHNCPQPGCTPCHNHSSSCFDLELQADAASCGDDHITGQIDASASASAHDDCNLVGKAGSAGVSLWPDSIRLQTSGGVNTMRHESGGRTFRGLPGCTDCCETFVHEAAFAFGDGMAQGELVVHFESECQVSIDIDLNLNSDSDLTRMGSISFPSQPASQQNRNVRFVSIEVTRLTNDPTPVWQTTWVQGAFEESVIPKKEPYISKKIGLFDNPAFDATIFGTDPDSSIAGSFQTSIENLSVRKGSDVTLVSLAETFSRYGDMNGDGFVCIEDREVLRGLADAGTVINSSTYTARGDFDLDGDIDYKDLDAFDKAVESEPDCNHNGSPDDCDIASGISLDDNHDGIPDECE